MHHIYAWFIDRNLEHNEFIRLLGYVSEEKRRRIKRYRWIEDAQRTLLGDILARYAICTRLGEKNSNLKFGVNEHGKPILLNPYSIHFNISHSGSWVVCAIGDHQIGIDVELIKPINLRIAEKCFSRKEYCKFMRQPTNIKLKYFYQLWTLKESYIKAIGKGLRTPLNSFTILIKSGNIKVFEENQSGNWHFTKYSLDNNHLMAVCTHEYDLGQIIKSYLSSVIKKDVFRSLE